MGLNNNGGKTVFRFNVDTANGDQLSKRKFTPFKTCFPHINRAYHNGTYM